MGITAFPSIINAYAATQIVRIKGGGGKPPEDPKDEKPKTLWERFNRWLMKINP